MKYNFGQREDYSVTSHYLDGKKGQEHYLDLKQFQEVEGAIVVRILKRDPNKSFIHMANERYIIPNATRVLLDFSEDGKILSIFIEKEDKSCQLKIVSLFDED